MSDTKWDDMKEDLLSAFGHRGVYSLDDKLHLIQSLTKADNETFKTFFFRIQWVMMKAVTVSAGVATDQRVLLLEIPTLLGYSGSRDMKKL